MWDSDVGHHTLAQVSSQSSRLDCLPEENDEHNTVVSSTQHVSPSPRHSKTDRRPNRRMSMPTRAQTVSGKRRAQSTY